MQQAEVDQQVSASITAKAAVLAIRAYQRMAPSLVRRACRFEPSCSEYAVVSFERHGFVRGLRLVWQRLIRCRPPYGGVDNPPLGLASGPTRRQPR